MEHKNKAVDLFNFIKGLNELKRKPITNIEKQIWNININDVPLYKDFVKIYSFDSFNTDSNLSCKFLSVQKPDFTACPTPDKYIFDWLEHGWEKFDKEVEIKNLSTIDSEANVTRITHFEDDPKRVSLFNVWVQRREEWRKDQRAIKRVQLLFSNLVMFYFDLKVKSETQEIIIANGFIMDSKDDQINHPIISKRINIEFDERKNEISLVDTQNSSELYSPLLRSMVGLNDYYFNEFSQRLIDQDYHPYDKEESSTLLKSFTSNISSQSIFSDEGVPKSWKNLCNYLVYSNPVVIVRNKLDGSLKAIESIIEDIKEKGEVPKHIIDIIVGGNVELPQEIEDESIDQILARAGGENIDIFLSKEANREQLEIAKRIDLYNAVLVQGPPGTGKTHTISNLLGHFLAQGKRVLITSHTPKALNVLKEKISPSIRDLCVSVLADNNTDMERSIDGITERLSRDTSSKLSKAMKESFEDRKFIIKELAKTRKNIYELINKERSSIVINGNEISPSKAAKFVVENLELDYIPGKIKMNSSLPLTIEELNSLYKSNEMLKKVDEDELNFEIPNPDDLLKPIHFKQICELEKEYSNFINKTVNATGWSIKNDNLDKSISITAIFGKITVRNINEKNLNDFKQYISNFSDLKPWMINAAIDGKRGSVYSNRWLDLDNLIKEAIKKFEIYTTMNFGKTIDESIIEYNKEFEENLNFIKTKIQSNGKITKIDRLFNKKIDSVLRSVTIDGKEINSVEDIDLLIAKCELIATRNKCEKYWDELIKINGEPGFYALSIVEPEQVAVKWSTIFTKYLNWYKEDYERLISILNSLGINSDTLFGLNQLDSEHDQISKILNVISNILPIILSICENQLNYETHKTELDRMEDFILQGKRSSSDLCENLNEAIKSRNDVKYALLYNKCINLFGKYTVRDSREVLLEKLEPFAKEWCEAIRNRNGIHGDSTLPANVERAWLWKQYSMHLKELTKEPYEVLLSKSTALSKQYRDKTAEYAENSAWYYLLKRTESDISMQQALVSWKQVVKKIGKGTGKRAADHKANARKLMIKCQEAVPAWIMTVNTAMETLDPRSNNFDIIIIDEASQSDLSSMAILYMGKKIIVVGDDKQISPSAVGVNEEDIQKLKRQFLSDDIQISPILDAKTSIYDVAATTFHPLTLVEHFRCVPEIINYSNYLSYDWKIKPLKDGSNSKLVPYTINHRVKGVQENKKNRGEADAIVSIIQACIEQPEYDGKSFGVITLLGEEQAKLIQMLLYEKLGYKEYTARQILCGNSANFQGDERDVIFLSMVDSNDKQGPLALRGNGPEDSYKKRYNVAVSRARDQIWLVHSLDADNDLKTGDLRKGLIDYFKNPKHFELVRKNIESKSDSPFETEVVSYLVSQGYSVHQQWEVGAYRLDMVVKCENRKIVVECDGERYHGPEKTASDMERQTILERVGWKFIRLRGSEYYSNKDLALKNLVQKLNINGIYPEDNEIIEYNATNTDLKNRVLHTANKYNLEVDGYESEAETTAAALSNDDYLMDYYNKPIVSENSNEKSKEIYGSLSEIVTYDQKAKVNDLEIDIDSLSYESEEEKLIEHEERINEENYDSIIETSVDPVHNLLINGYEIVDNRKASKVLWVIGEYDHENNIREILSETIIKSMSYQKRGAFSTGGKPAWLITFKEISNG